MRGDFESLPESRDFEVGWVGNTRGRSSSEGESLPVLEDQFVMNDWHRRYSSDAIPGIYGRSKVVVNISGDDLPSDANHRVFEAMAAGALL